MSEFLGPMPAALFLAEFVPNKGGDEARPGYLDDSNFFVDVPNIDAVIDEDTLKSDWSNTRAKCEYEPLRERLQRALSPCVVAVGPRHLQKLSAAEDKWQPDLLVFDGQAGENSDPKGLPTQPEKAQLFIRVASHEARVFRKPWMEDEPFILGWGEAEFAQGGILLALTQQLNCQWRNFAFSLLFNDPYAHIIRADRGGAIVTEPINFRTEPGPLLEFLWRFNFLSPEERGMDLTARLATNPEDIKTAKEKLAAHVSKRRQARPVYIVEVPDATKPREVLVWGGLSNCDSLTGRSTRFAAVWDPEAEKVRFLKDVWRTDAETTEGESDILRILNDAKVEHVPTLFAGGDVAGRYHRTVTQKFARPTPSWIETKPTRDMLDMWTHHRLLEDFIPTPLEDFKTPKGFLQVLFDAFLAHKGAYALGFLHCDVSDGNIMIDENGRGVLIDWELAIRVRDKNGALLENEARQHDRAGTWEFMSCDLLRPRSIMSIETKTHGLPDDQQSFLWLGLYYILLNFNPVIPGNPSIEDLVEKVFEQRLYDTISHEPTGGNFKRHIIYKNYAVCQLAIPSNKPMEEWFKKALEVFALTELYGHFSDPDPMFESILKKLPPKPDLEQHDALERIFRDSLDADGWSPTREPKNN